MSESVQPLLPQPVSSRPSGWRWMIAFLSVFLFITVARWEIIDSPPYYDFALGLFTEANYLVDSGFDYHRLRHVEQAGNEGGPRVYMISIAPTLLALLMKVAPSTRFVLIVGHLCTIAAATILLLALVAMLRPHTGTGPAIAATAIMAASPLFSTQVDMLGIDLPMTAAGVVAIALASRGQFGWASIAATVSFAIKPSGLIATIAVLAYQIGTLVAARMVGATNQRTTWRRVWLLASTCLLLLGQLYIYRWSSLGERLQRLATGSGYLEAALSLYPDQVLVFAVCALTTVVALARMPWSARWRTPWSARVGQIDVWLLLVVAWLIIAATLAAVVVYARVYSVRYLLLAIPFLFAILGLTVLRHLTPRVLGAVTVGAVGFNLANWNGDFYPRVNVFPRHCSCLERSHEYLADHQSNVKLMQRLEQSIPHTPIVAGFPFPFFLSYPRLGYVSQPLGGYSINPFAGHLFPSVTRLFDKLPSELVFIRVDNALYAYASVSVPPPGPGDTILYRDTLPSPLVAYHKDLGNLGTTDDQRNNWLIEHLWLDAPGQSQLRQPFYSRALRLAGDGYRNPAIALIERSARRDEFEVALLLGRLLLEAGRRHEAVDTLAAAARQRPGDPTIHLMLGHAWLARSERAQARREFDRALAIDASLVEAHHQLGVLALQDGHTDAAIQHLGRCVELVPDSARAHNSLGVAWANQRNWTKARDAFARALELDVHFTDARQNLRQVEAALQRVPRR